MRRDVGRWLILVAGVSVVLALLQLPRERVRNPWYSWGWEEYPEITKVAGASWSARLRANRAEATWRRAESRAMVTEARPRLTGPLTITVDARLSPTVKSHLDSVVRAEFSASAVRAPAVPILVVAVADSARRGPNAYERVVVLPQSPGDPCAVIVRVPRWSRNVRFISPSDRLLGPCGFFAAYGPPGAGTLAWLRETGSESAQYLATPPALAGDTATLDFESLYGQMRRPDIRGCRAGREEACVALVSPTPANQAAYTWYRREEFSTARQFPGVLVYGAESLSGTGMAITGGLLSGLAAELGPTRFGAIWRSDRGLLAEYERQEGRSLARWTGAFLETRVAPYQPGPGVPWFPALISLVLLALFSALGTLKARRAMT